MASPDVFGFAAGTRVGYGGRGASLPAWAVASPLNTWMEIAGPGFSTSGAGGTQIESYSGWAKLPNGKIAITLAGGHGDGQKNSTAVIDLLASAPAWTEVGAESPVHANDIDYQPDGKPTTSHIYYTAMWVPSLNRLCRVGSVFISGGLTNQYPHVDGFNLATNTWDAAGTHPDLPGGIGFGNLYNPLLNKIVCVGDYIATYVDPINAATTAVSAPGVSIFPRNPYAWDSKRGQIFGMTFGNNEGYNGAAGIIAAIINGTTASAITIAPSAAKTTLLAEAPLYSALEYDEANDYFLFYSGRDVASRARVYKITPNATTTWPVEVFQYGSGGITPVTTVDSGLMNKFSYVPALKGFVMMATKASNLYFMRTA